MGKFTKIFPIFCIFYAGVLDVCMGVEKNETHFEDFNLTTIEIIRNYGYPAEVHKVQTEDGYILELHRIPYGKFSDSKPGVPILMVHGLLASSIEFLLLESDSLAFVLADAGYDVWLLNFRGSTYSRNHRTLQSDDKKFWNFSWHEKGLYDIPSSIDYICKYTQRDKLLYLGFSMGTTAFFVMSSMRPEYQEKLQGAILLGPTAYLKHTKTPLRVLAPFSKTIRGLYEFIGKGGVFEHTPELQNFMEVVCKPQFFCKNFLFLIAGRNSQGFSNNVLPKAVMHIPAGTSIKTAAHYGQLITSGKFQQYDYGTANNLRRYNQPKPPIYNLEAINIPLILFVAPNDFFTTRKDLERLFQRLHSVKNVHVIPCPKFTHVDFVVSKNLQKLLYPQLLKEVEYLMSHETAAKHVQKRPKAHQSNAVPNMNYNQDHQNRIQNTRTDQDRISYNSADQITMNHNIVDRNKVVYNEPQYKPVDQIKYIYNNDIVDYNLGDYHMVNQSEAEQNKNIYNEVDYNLIDQNKVMYNEPKEDKFVYYDGQYNQAVQNEMVYKGDQYSQAINQDNVVYNSDYSPVAYYTVNQNKILYNEAEQNKNVYSEGDYNLIDQNKVVYNEANPEKGVYSKSHYNQVVQNEVVYNEDQYSQALDQDKRVYNADYNPSDYNIVNQNEAEQNKYISSEADYNLIDENKVVYNDAQYNQAVQNEVIYNKDQYSQAIDQSKVYCNADYNSANQNEEVYDQNEVLYKVDYIPIKYKKVNYLPLNYKNVDYSGAQYSDF